MKVFFEFTTISPIIIFFSYSKDSSNNFVTHPLRDDVAISPEHPKIKFSGFWTVLGDLHKKPWEEELLIVKKRVITGNRSSVRRETR